MVWRTLTKGVSTARPREAVLSFSTTRGHSRKDLSLSEETGPLRRSVCWHLVLGLPASRTVRNMFLSLWVTQLPALCYSTPKQVKKQNLYQEVGDLL
jgi:hypothetical protein